MSDRIDIGLVNNMPDSALKGTERQFRHLLEQAADGLAVRLHLFTLPEIARSERARQHCRESYGSLGDLLSSRLDALIVTGAEPQTARLRDEPYWRSLTAVFDWAADTTVSTILSCLAAHAGVLHFDGIERTKLPQKCLGRFDLSCVAEHPLTRGAPTPWRVPHSRCNEVGEAALVASGYTVLSRSEQAGIDLFAKQRGSLFLFCQGHPEYGRETLYKEYQRDIRRYLTGERDTYPATPSGYFDRDSEMLLAQFAARATQQRDLDVLRAFPPVLLDGARASGWSSVANCVYGNWLSHIAAEKAARLAAVSSAPPRAVALREPMLAA